MRMRRAAAIAVIVAMAVGLAIAKTAGAAHEDGEADLGRTLDTDGDGTFTAKDELKVVDALHRALDKDSDGDVSAREMGKDAQNKDRVGSDVDGTSTVSSKELREFWMKSAVHNWSPEMVAAWVATIGFPQYARGFKALKVDGRMLPSLAMDHGVHLRTKLGVSNVDSEVLARAIVSVVFGIGAPPVPASAAHYYVEGLLVALLVTVAGAAYHFYQQQERIHPVLPRAALLNGRIQRHFIERAQMDRRISETAGQVREAEALMAKLRDDAVAERETVLTKVRQEFASESKEEQQRRLAVSAWMQTKYEIERAKYERRFSDLQALRHRIEQQSAEASRGLFGGKSRAARALEDNAHLEDYENRLERWRSEFADCLLQWKLMHDLGYLNAPGLLETHAKLVAMARAAPTPKQPAMHRSQSARSDDSAHSI